MAEERLLRAAAALPAGVRATTELAQLLSNPEASLFKTAEVIKRDAALTARLVRVANSALLAQDEPVTSLENAAALLGFREVHRLVGGMAMQQAAGQGLPAYGVGARRFQENALLTALLMEEFACATLEDPPTAYTVGLLRTLGKLVLDQLGDGLPGRATPQTALAEWEEQNFGLSGNAVAEVILESWHLPADISRAVAAHYHPMKEYSVICRLLNFTARIAEELGRGLPGESVYWVEAEAMRHWLGLDADAVKRHTARAFTAFERLSQSLG